jgi:transcriptional regulator with XRE-family HTH domain
MRAAPEGQIEQHKPVLLPVGRDYVRKAMAARGLSVTALAAELGISRKHLSNVLNGRAPLIDPLLHRLSSALQIPPSFLVCLLDDGVRPEPGQSSYGCMKGSIVWHGDLTEPMEDWEMLQD